MRKKEDARVTRTKSSLFDSFRDLLAEKPFEDITINEICLRAGIRRATFYKHFSDKYDFLAALTNELRAMFEKNFWTPTKAKQKDLSDYYVDYLVAIIDFFDKNYSVVELIFKSNMTSVLIDVIVEENYKKTLERLESDTKCGLKLVASPETIALYLSGGISNSVIKWLKNGKKTPREEMIRDLTALVLLVFEK